MACSLQLKSENEKCNEPLGWIVTNITNITNITIVSNRTVYTPWLFNFVFGLSFSVLSIVSNVSNSSNSSNST
jgi:hypothetical protein